MSDETRSHYDRLGGVEAIRAAVDKLYLRILRDDRLAPYFSGVDVARVKRHQVLFLCALLGGPQTYDGPSLYQAHRGLGITPADYDRVVDHLEDVLVAAGAPEGTLVAVSDALVGAKPEIVEVPRDP
ncbi:MAG TPA: group 1 truncated hemoglobin [Acidimicrobiales bacterium]|nr:group 1 truncated hemoglobin [Acidimicrobiales bacterium]